ncbi:hypothetical protein MBLNU13_g04538t2 [Cladosporium sp. NU13]
MVLAPQRRSTATAANTPSTSNGLNITFGIEHEFLVLDSQRLNYQNQEKADHGLSLVSEALQKPMQITCSSCGQTHDYEQPIRVQDKLNDNSDHSCWNLVGDLSMKLKTRQDAILRENRCEAYGVELTSRVLSVQEEKSTTRLRVQAKHIHSATYKEEISRFIKTANELFPPQATATGHRQERRVVVNDTCSLHVHIGNGTSGFELQTVKNLLSICTAFERIMDNMHVATRIGSSALAFSPLDDYTFETDADIMAVAKDGSRTPLLYNRSLTERMFSNAYVARRNDNDTPLLAAARGQYPASQMDRSATLKAAASGYHTMAFVEVIQQAPDIESLQNLLSLCCETTVNILHLVANEGENVNEERSYRRLNTIEFRQHAAITDPREALAWINFLQTLVNYAHIQSADNIRSICENVASDSSFKLSDLFELLGVGQETRAVYLTRSKESIQATFDLERAEAEAFDSDDPFRTISLELINERAADHDPDNVARTIREKFEQGGYGQFTRKFIDSYAPHLSDENKEMLTIGWVVPAKFDSDSESDCHDDMAIDNDDEMLF